MSPDYTNGGEVEPFAIMQSGDSSIVHGLTGFAGAVSDEGLVGGWYRLVRTSTGWTPTPLALPSSGFAAAESLPLISLDGASSVWLERGAGMPDNELDLYVEHEDGSILDIGSALPTSAPGGMTPEEERKDTEVNLAPVSVSDDGSRVFFSIGGEAHWPFDKTHAERNSLYEYVGSGNTTPMLVGLSNSGTQLSECGVVLGSGKPTAIGTGITSAHNAVSSDGKTVFFTAYPADSSCSGTAPPVAELLARIENAPGSFETVQISEPSESDCVECRTNTGLANAEFEGASEDGSRAFFATEQALLPGAKGLNLYEYRFGPGVPAGERVIRVSAPDASVSKPLASEVVGRVVQVSEDGSHVYFVAHGVLTENENSIGEFPRRGADNLYAFEQDTQYPEGHIAFIADMCSGPERSGSLQDGRCPADLSSSTNAAENYGGRGLQNDIGLWGGVTGFNQFGSNVTPDGRFLVFTSFGDLTPDDTSSAAQVFEYDSVTGKLVRVSIGQNGFKANGNTALDDAEIASPVYIGHTNGETLVEPTTYWTHLSVSEDGSYVFFQSMDGLTQQAANDTVIAIEQEGRVPVYAENVYEYHSTGGDIGNGNVYLISDGQDLNVSNGNSTVRFLGADASGQDVFFTTLDPLAPQQTNENVSIYDARIEGGFPAPSLPATCEGDTCQGALSPAPTLLSPGSEFQAPSGPPTVTPASKPAVKKKTKTKKPKRKLKRRAKKARASAGRKSSKRSIRKARNSGIGMGAKR